MIHLVENRAKLEILYWVCIRVAVNLCDLMLSSAADTYCAISCYIGILSFVAVDFNWCMRNDRLQDLWISHFFKRVCKVFTCQNVTCSIKSPVLIFWLHDQESTSRKIDQVFFWNRYYSGLIASMIGYIKDVASSKVNKITDFWSIYVRDINSKISS